MIAQHRVKTFLVACVTAAALLQLTPTAGRPAPRAFTKNSPTASAPQTAKPDARPEPPHTLAVTVTNERGEYITGLAPETFTVTDGGQRSEIVSFVSGDMPATVGILLDASGSMLGGGSSPDRVSNALLRFFQKCNRSDEFFLMAFNRSPQLLLGMSNDWSAILSALVKFAGAQPKGQTAFYDALYLALNQAARGKHRKRAILLVSDGEDNMSRYTFSELRRQLKESDVILYAVDIIKGDEDNVLGYQGWDKLDELTRMSGGKVFAPRNTEQLYDSMERIAIELRTQYMIGFVPAPAANKDGWHEVKFKLGEIRDARGKKVRAFLRAREGFYGATAAPK